SGLSTASSAQSILNLRLYPKPRSFHLTPLQDIRVLAVTVYLAGPFLSMTLARFGAEVIKVEAPGSGDPARNLGPFAGPRGVAHDRGADDISIPFLKRSEGVKCVTLNLRDAEG